MNSITITIPQEYHALMRAGDMFKGMARDLGEPQQLQGGHFTDDQKAAIERGAGPYLNADSVPDYAMSPEEAARYADFGPSSTAVDDQHAPDREDKDAASVFGKPETATTATAPETTPPPATTAEVPAPSPGATEAGVELDSDGLPWDHRIHSGSKGKLAKTDQWKKKRGVDPELVEQVEAELRAAMSASPANPVEPDRKESATPATPTPAPAPAPVEQPKQDATGGAITSFPALMQRITAAGLDQATITAAVNKQGLSSLPLLAARADLIPAVAAELFPEG